MKKVVRALGFFLLFLFLGVLGVKIYTKATNVEPEAISVPTSDTITPVSPEMPTPGQVIVYQQPVDIERVVTLYGEVDSANIDQAIAAIMGLESQSSDDIYLLIASPGGSVFDGERLLSVMEGSRAKVKTVCMSLCASMAAIIHQYGAERLATDRSILMFHDASGSAQGEVKKMQSLLNMIEFKLERTDRYIAARSGMSYEQFRNLHAYDLWLDSSIAVRAHMVDRLVSIKFNAPFIKAPDTNSLMSQFPELENFK